MVSSKFIHLPLPRESQEKLSANIAQYNSIIDQQNFLASQQRTNEAVLHQMRHVEEQRIALAKDQIEILSQFIPSEQLWSQMMGTDYMASISLQEHPAKNFRSSSVPLSSKGNSQVMPVNLVNGLALPGQDVNSSKMIQNYMTTPSMFDSLMGAHDETSSIYQGRHAIQPPQVNDSKHPSDQISSQAELSNQYSQPSLSTGTILNGNLNVQTHETYTSEPRDHLQIKHSSPQGHFPSQFHPNPQETLNPFASNEGSHPQYHPDSLEKCAALASKDFNDWIEKGLFRQIHSFMPGQDKTANQDKKTTNLSLIAEVPDDKSDCSPTKAHTSAHKEKSAVTTLNEELIRNLGATANILNKSRAVSAKENSFFSASTYPQENVDLAQIKKSCSQELLEEAGRSQLSCQDGKSFTPVPIFTSQKVTSDHLQDSSASSQQSTPLKMMGTVYVSNPHAVLSYHGPRYSDFAIKEADVEEEDEAAQDMRIKEMTPQRSTDFNAQKINTDCSASLSGNEHSQVLQGGNFNVVFPSLRFSSAKLDKSIQVRASLNVTEGQCLKFECTNFIYLDQQTPAEGNINAYLIEPIHFDGVKASHQVQDASAQTEAVSPFMATQIVQELLKSKDFAAELKNADANQAFTITVTQDEANNDFVIDVELSQEFDNNDQQLLQTLSARDQKEFVIKGPSDRASLGDIDHPLKIVSKTESIKEMSELGHTNHLLNFDFIKKENFGDTHRLTLDQKVGIHTITENQDQENSPGRSDSLEDDQVTIDNPLLKEYDATASPDKHARTSRLEEIFEHGGYRSATSDVIGNNSNPDSDHQRPGYMSLEERDYFNSGNKHGKAPLYHIVEQSVEDSEHLRVSKQNNRNSIDAKDNQSEVFNSKAYERLFGEATQVSDTKYDRSKKGLKSMTAYHSKEGLNTICEEDHLGTEQTQSFVDFITKQDGKASTHVEIQEAAQTPSKKTVEIEDLIKSRSEKKAPQTSERAQSHRGSPDSGLLKTAEQPAAAIQRAWTEPLTIEMKKEHIYVVRHCEKRLKKDKSARSIAGESNASRSKSKSSKREPQIENETKNKQKNSEENAETLKLETLSLRIPDKVEARKKEAPGEPEEAVKKDSTSSKTAKETKPALNRRSPTPTRGKAATSNGDLKSVSQIKKGLSNDNLSYTSNNHALQSPMTQKTQKKSTTPVKSKDVPAIEKPKLAKRESSPYAPEKYKTTIQTLFHDQMAPVKKHTSTNVTNKHITEKIKQEKPHGIKIDSSLTQFNQISDCETYSITSGHNREFTRNNKNTLDKPKAFAHKHMNANSSFTHDRNLNDIMEADGNKSHRSTRSHMPANTKTGLGPLFEDVIAEHNTSDQNTVFLKAASSTNVATQSKSSASLKKQLSPQLGFPERPSKQQRAPECNSLSKNSQGKQSAQTFGYPEQGRSKPQSLRQSVARSSASDNILRDRILNEFITGLCSTGILNEEDCANENFFIENEAIMIDYDSMTAICAELGFLPEDFDPEDEGFER